MCQLCNIARDGRGSRAVAGRTRRFPERASVDVAAGRGRESVVHTETRRPAGNRGHSPLDRDPPLSAALLHLNLSSDAGLRAETALHTLRERRPQRCLPVAIVRGACKRNAHSLSPASSRARRRSPCFWSGRQRVVAPRAPDRCVASAVRTSRHLDTGDTWAAVLLDEAKQQRPPEGAVIPKFYEPRDNLSCGGSSKQQPSTQRRAAAPAQMRSHESRALGARSGPQPRVGILQAAPPLAATRKPSPDTDRGDCPLIVGSRDGRSAGAGIGSPQRASSDPV